MRHTIFRPALRAVIGLAITSPVSAQDVAETPLAQPNASIKDAFRTPSTALALSDGRLVVVDPRLEKMVRVDFASGEVQELMKEGDDDGQYGGIRRLWAWQGDSIAAMDSVNARAMILPADGGAARLMPFGPAGRRPQAAAPGGRGGRGGRGGGGAGGRGGGGLSPQFLMPGQIIFTAGMPRPTPPRAGFAPPRNSLPILRMSPGRRPDTIARFLPPQPNKAPVTLRNSSSGVNAITYTLDISEYVPSDAWFVYNDGTVGVVRGADYHIDLYGPGDARSKFDPIDFPKVAISKDEKKRTTEWYKRLEQSRVEDRNFAVVIDEGWPWPDHHPPFRHDVPIRVDENDRAWLSVRCASTDKAECYDVIARDGKRVMRLRLPERTSLLAVGKDHVYTAFFEKSDKAVLQRHPLNLGTIGSATSVERDRHPLH